MGVISRQLSRILYPSYIIPSLSTSPKKFCSSSTHIGDDSLNNSNNASESPPQSQGPIYEGGIDGGIYKAILVGVVGPSVIQKTMKSGNVIAHIAVGTGGVRNNRRPMENEDPRDYANRSNVLWHRVSIYLENLAKLVSKEVHPGSLVYVEGNLETHVFSDDVTGLVRRIRQVSVRRDGRIVFLGQGPAMATSRWETMRAGFY